MASFPPQSQPGRPATGFDQLSPGAIQALFEPLVQACWETDAQGMAVTDSPSWRAYTGQTTAEWLGDALGKGVDTGVANGWVRAVHPDEQANVLAGWQAALLSGVPFEAECRLRSPGGGWRWTNVRAVAQRDPTDGSIQKWIGINTNIDDRKRADDALRASEERLLTLFEHLPGAAAFVLDPALRYTLANGEALRAVGAQPTDFVGKTIFEVLDADRAATYEPFFRQALGGQPFTYEHGVDGHYFQSKGVPLRAAGGEVEAVVVLSYDITERRHNEERLRLAETNQRAILDSTRQSILLIAPDYSLIQFNRYAALAAATVFGQTMQPGQPILDYVADKERADFIAHFQQALTGEAVSVERQVDGLDGPSWWEFFYYPIRQPDGQVSGVTFAARDITERRQIEEGLRRSEERFRTLMQNLPDYAIFRLDAQGFITEWTEGAERVKGYTADEAVGQHLALFYTPEERAAGEPGNELRQAARTGRVEREQMRIRKGGERFWVNEIATAIYDADGGLAGFTKISRDITERIRVDEALRNSEEKYRMLFEMMHQGFGIAEIIADEAGRPVDYRMLEINQQFERLTGQSRQTFLDGRSMREVAPELEDEWYSFYGNVGLTGVPAHRDIHAETWNRWFDVSAYPTGLPGQQRVAIFYSDITERKQAEQRQAFMLSLSDALAPLADPVAIQATVTRSAMTYFGADRCYYCLIDNGNAIISQDAARPDLPSVAGVYPLDSMPLFDAVVKAGRPLVIANVHTTELLDEPLRQHCLQREMVSFVNIPVIKNGQPVGLLCITQDTPKAWLNLDVDLVQVIAERTWAAVERANAEAALAQSERFIKGMMTSLPLVIYVFDLQQQRNLFLSPQVEQVFGYTADQMQASGAGLVPQFFHPDDLPAISAYFEAIGASVDRQTFSIECRMKHRQRGWTWVQCRDLVYQRDADGRPTQLLGTAEDISDRKRADTALREADQRKDEFLAMLAHELRNPLAPIRNVLQVLQLTAAADETVASGVRMMSRQVDHLVRLIDDLLDVSRISRGKIELRRERIDLTTVVQQAVEASKPLYADSGRALSVALPTPPLYMDGDATRLMQVVSNLLTNGVRYTAANGHVGVSLTLVENWAELRVRDDGIGLASDQLEAIFELFVQVDNSLARSQGGLGLGLTLVKKLVEMHGGRVQARSEGLGRGSEFIVHLPLLPASTTPETTNVPDAVATVGYRLLVVDDNHDAADTLAMLLRLSKNDVHVRYGGRDAIAAIDSLRPEVVLLDIGMPELDGYDTCWQIRQLPGGDTLVLIALTGYGQEDDKRRSLEAGFDGHLTKPVDLSVLNALLNQLLPRP